MVNSVFSNMILKKTDICKILWIQQAAKIILDTFMLIVLFAKVGL